MERTITKHKEQRDKDAKDTLRHVVVVILLPPLPFLLLLLHLVHGSIPGDDHRPVISAQIDLSEVNRRRHL